MLLAIVGSAAAQTPADDLAERAAALPPAPARYMENIKFGVRGVSFRVLAFSPTNPDVMYAASYNGFVFATHDGGVTWEEGRLITRRSRFFGAIRPSLAPNGAPVNVEEVLRNLDTSYSISEAFRFPFGTTDSSVLDLSPDKPIFSPGLNPGLNLPRAIRVWDTGSAGGGGGDSSRFGVGIVRAAPRLQALLKRRGARLIGLNLKLLINLRGTEPTYVNHISVHPTNPRIALVATAMGLYKTTDGGVGWDHVFAGRNTRERRCHYVAFDPRDPNRIYLGTGQGLLIATDGGDKFDRVSGTQLSTAVTRWLQIHPKNPAVVYAGTFIGVFRSDDGGVNWRWVFFETLPQANRIQGIAMDPEDPDRVTIATDDGMFRTPDGGRTWERSGAFLFTSMSVGRVVSDPADGQHLLCTTYRRVWESFDWGDTWQAMYINDSEWSPRAVAFDSREKGAFWVLTSSEILRLSENPPLQPDPARIGQLREQLAREPTLSQAMDAAFRVHTAHRGERSALRARSALAQLLPRVSVFGGYLQVDTGVDLSVAYLNSYRPGGGTGGTDDYTVFRRQLDDGLPYAGVMANWNLMDLIFQQEEAPFGRYFGLGHALHNRLKFEVQRLYEERRRLLVQIISVPPDNLRALLALRLRLEELTAHLNALTGGLYEPWLQWLEQDDWTKGIR